MTTAPWATYNVHTIHEENILCNLRQWREQNITSSDKLETLAR